MLASSTNFVTAAYPAIVILVGTSGVDMRFGTFLALLPSLLEGSGISDGTDSRSSIYLNSEETSKMDACTSQLFYSPHNSLVEVSK